MNFGHLPKWILRLVKYPPRLAYALGLGSLIGGTVLLLTTIGRKSGRPRTTPLQYEEIDGTIYLGSARGAAADWYRNITADPHVNVQVKNRRFDGLAEPTTDVGRMTDYLALRLKRHPRMIGGMLRAEGLPPSPTREQLEGYAAKLALVAIRLAPSGAGHPGTIPPNHT